MLVWALFLKSTVDHTPFNGVGGASELRTARINSPLIIQLSCSHCTMLWFRLYIIRGTHSYYIMH